jgi:hypothetical protein
MIARLRMPTKFDWVFVVIVVAILLGDALEEFRVE